MIKYRHLHHRSSLFSQALARAYSITIQSPPSTIEVNFLFPRYASGRELRSSLRTGTVMLRVDIVTVVGLGVSRRLSFGRDGIGACGIGAQMSHDDEGMSKDVSGVISFSIQLYSGGGSARLLRIAGEGSSSGVGAGPRGVSASSGGVSRRGDEGEDCSETSEPRRSWTSDGVADGRRVLEGRQLEDELELDDAER